MNLVSMSQEKTMSSREIADLTNKEHAKVTADIVRTLSELELDAADFRVIYKDALNRDQFEYCLPKRECLILVSGYSVALRARIIDRWQELESQHATKLPQTKLEWMQLAVEQEQSLIAQQVVIDDQVEKLAIAAPAVQFVERYVETKSSKSLSDVAKVIGWKPQAFIKQLADDKVLFKRGGAWIPFQSYLDREHFTVTTGESNGHAFNQTRVTSSGVAWLAKEYGR